MGIKPPPVLDNIRILAYVSVKPTIRFTGVLRLNVGGKWLGAVPGLAIGKDLRTKELLLVHCSEQWIVQGVQAWNAPGVSRPTTIHQIKVIAEKYYPGLMAHWRRHDATAKEAIAYHRRQMARFTCSFCGQISDNRLFVNRNARICDECIRKFYLDLMEE